MVKNYDDGIAAKIDGDEPLCIEQLIEIPLLVVNKMCGTGQIEADLRRLDFTLKLYH